MKSAPLMDVRLEQELTGEPEDAAPEHDSLVLALGNDLLGDDGVGLTAARILRDEVAGKIDILETSIAGYALLEILQGYKNVLLLDAICTGASPVGTIHDCSTGNFKSLSAPSPHCVGLPDVIELAKTLDIPFPSNIHVLAAEIAPPTVLHEGLSEEIWHVIPQYIERARGILREWLKPEQAKV